MTTTARRQRSDGARSKDTILRTAASLATVDGLDGITIGNLALHIGMSKSGLYAHFGSKEELQLATVDKAFEIFSREVIEPTLSVADPLEQLLALVDSFIDHLERHVFPGGCFFATTWVEFGTKPGPVKDRILEISHGWLEHLRGLITAAQAAGELSAAEDPAQLAFELEAYLLLGNTEFVATNDAAHLRRAREAVARRLAATAPR
jgi:AcrR family transcriptional regulator